MKIKNLLIIAIATCISTSILVLGSSANPVLVTKHSQERKVDPLDKKIIPIIDTEIGSILGGAAVTPTAFYLVGAKETYEYIKDKTDRITLNSFAPVANYEDKLKITGFSKAGENCENFYGVALDKPIKGILIGTSGNWQPDYPKPQDLWKKQAGKYWQNQTYKKVTADFLKTKGIGNPKVQIIEAKKIDFDGDGTDEVIINAAYFKNKTNPFELNPGDYHVVFVRKIVNGKVKDILIEGQFANGKDVGAVMEHDIYAILDLEGDGRKEIILHSKVPEGRWSKVFHIEGNGFVEVLRTGCSA
ncbi:MAG: hypothetical protein OEM82_05970 [Acidobacteriota bacterium]|nr:hypothetical protein [Acidobacteriota bacterium]MDH3528492.1 hypothetical protein [Acidobacteriota bacterium]